jgi:hypothetical protein
MAKNQATSKVSAAIIVIETAIFQRGVIMALLLVKRRLGNPRAGMLRIGNA